MCYEWVKYIFTFLSAKNVLFDAQLVTGMVRNGQKKDKNSLAMGMLFTDGTNVRDLSHRNLNFQAILFDKI